MTDVHVLVLAAGKGTRMKSAQPKVLHSVGGATLLDRVLNLCLDKGYDYDGPRQIAYDDNLTAHIRCRGEESKTLPDHPNYKPRRWVVERVHSWINRFRRLLIRWEKKPQNYEAMLQFACGIIAWEQAALQG